MPETKALVPTENASQYLRQLCKHFAHKVAVEVTQDQGIVALPFGTCHLRATSQHLELTGVSNPANLPRLERFLGDHLARFAFRENPKIEWQRAAQTQLS